MVTLRFVEWIDDQGVVISTSNSINLLVDRDATITAHYAEITTSRIPIIAAAAAVIIAILSIFTLRKGK